MSPNARQMVTLLIVAVGISANVVEGKQPSNIITASGAIACQSKLHLFEIVSEAVIYNNPEGARAKLAAYISGRKCAKVTGWHYRVIGRVGQHGEYTSIEAGPTNEASLWNVWFIPNEWVEPTPEPKGKSSLSPQQAANVECKVAVKEQGEIYTEADGQWRRIKFPNKLVFKGSSQYFEDTPRRSLGKVLVFNQYGRQQNILHTYLCMWKGDDVEDVTLSPTPLY